MSMVLKKGGYYVLTANDGYDALAQLRSTLPDIVISDLNMPRMSGVELLRIVRVRFPHIPLVAMSGAYDFNDHLPGGLVADAVYRKGSCRLTELEEIVAGLIRRRSTRENPAAREPASEQVPIFRNRTGGELSIKLCCTECLQSFSVEFEQEVRMETRIVQCAFCAAAVHYLSRSLAAMLRKVYEANEAGQHSNQIQR